MRTGIISSMGNLRGGVSARVYEKDMDTYTKLLIHADGADSTTTNLIDFGSGKPIIANGDAQIKEGIPPVFGTNCGRWNGVSSYLAVPHSADWDFGSGDFAVDFWVYLTDVDRYVGFLDQYDNPTNYFDFSFNYGSFANPPDGILYFRAKSGGSIVGGVATTSSANLLPNTWYHLAFVRSGSNGYIFVNGVSQPVTSLGAFGTWPDLAAGLRIGYTDNTGQYMKGYMDEFRISKGTNRGWTSNFTPPTSAYASDSSTKLLLHLDDNVTDSGSVVYAVTNNNVVFNSSKFGGSSCYFDGTGDYLTSADHDDWNFGTGPFTIDMWVRFNGAPGAEQDFYSQCDEANNYIRFYYSSSRLYFQCVLASVTQFTIYIPWSPSSVTWYHLAVTRTGFDSAGWHLFVNGVEGSKTLVDGSYANAVPDLAKPLNIGFLGYGGYYCFNGWMDEFRISKGIARWTRNFTPPALPYQDTWYGDTYTKLLLHCDGANGSTAVYDNEVTPKAVTVLGSTQCSTDQKKFGASSIKFNGTTDYMTLLDTDDWYFGTGALTVDYWIKWNSVNYFFIDQWENDTTRTAFTAHPATLVLYSMVSSAISVRITTTNSLNTGQWYHIAFVRIDNGNTGASWRIFIDGVSQVLSLTHGAWNGAMAQFTSPLYIGVQKLLTPASYFDGYIDELRITKGLARWQANFTPPNQAYYSNLTSLTMAGLDGDTHREYELLMKMANGYAGASYLNIRLNGDAANNYGIQHLDAAGGAIGASNDVGVSTMGYLGETSANGYSWGKFTLTAKSGSIREGKLKSTRNISGTTIDNIDERSVVWSNVTDNVTSISLVGSQTNCIGPGSSIELWRPLDHS